MHKQIKYKVSWVRRKSVLLLVLFFSFALTGFSIYLFLNKNNWLAEQFVKSPQGYIQGSNFSSEWAYSCAGIAILVMVGVIGLLFREIISRNKRINELRIQNEYYRVTVDSIGDGLIITGKEGDIIHMNPVAEKLTGWYNNEAILHPVKKVFEITNEELSKTFEEKMTRILKKGQTVQFANNILLNTKNKKLIIANGSPLSDADGNICGSLLLFNGITEKKENIKILDQSEIFNKGILDALNSHFVVINSRGVIIKANKAWNNFALDNYENDLEKYEVGANYFSIYNSLINEENNTFSKALDGTKRVLDGTLREFYLEYPCNSSGIERWFSMRVMKFENAEALVVIEQNDITKRKKEEEKMLKAIERYGILSQATSDTIWDWDIPGNQVIYNEGITKMFGYKISEVENAVEWWKMNIHPCDLQRVSETLADVFKNRIQNFQLDYRYRHAGGSYKYIYDRAFVIYDPNGGPTRIIGAMQDITYEKEEEKRMAKAIIDAEERERRYIGQELHDNVNQILAGSLLTIAMAKQKHIDVKRTGELMDMSEEYLVQAIDEVRKLSHKLAPALFAEMTLRDIFQNLLLRINVNNQFIIKFHFDEIINVSASEDIQINLYRILQEQVRNILKYSSAKVIEITVSLFGDTVRMRIFDNGNGFDLKIAKKGIGLSNIKQRVDSFAGKFILNSAPGTGCEMIIEIPLK